MNAKRLLRTVWVLVPIALAACSSGYQSEALGLEWKPPTPFRLEAEQAGPPPVARFAPGLELRRVELKLPAPSAETVNATLEQIREAAAIPAGVTLISARAGSIPAGPVARYELKLRSDRLLVYVLPTADAVVLLTMRADEAQFGKRQNAFERSLATLKLRQAGNRPGA